jgi:2'-5' RNA ligase
MRPTTSALIVPAPELTKLLGPFRTPNIHTPARSVPPHVTLHVPFRMPDQLDQALCDGLAALFAPRASFRYQLRALRRFPESGVLYLAPEPAEPFLELSYLIQRRYPDAPPDYPTPIMHMTLAHGHPSSDLDALEQEFAARYGNQLPLNAVAREVALYAKREDRLDAGGVVPARRLAGERSYSGGVLAQLAQRRHRAVGQQQRVDSAHEQGEAALDPGAHRGGRRAKDAQP